MSKLLFVLYLACIILPCSAQTHYPLKGKVIDKESREALIGVTVYDKKNMGIGTTTDANGQFSLSLTAGKHVIVCSYIGYDLLETEVQTGTPTELVFMMNPGVLALDEVVVSSNSPMSRINNVQIGVENIEIAEMAKVPTLFGERDIIRSMQLLPGIKSESDGSSGFQVRGGTSAQNLILLDDATVYNAGHLMGIFSTFNDDALTNASLYKGQIPAQFGGATSSVFDINTKGGNMQEYKFSGSIGLLSAKLNVEGPICKDKASFFVAARRTYLDLFLKLTEDYKKNKMAFYDINAKVNYNMTDRDLLFISFFNGRDNMGMDDLVSMKWGNSTGTMRWFHQFNDKLYSNTSLFLSSYSSDNGIEILDQSTNFDSYMKQAGLKESFAFTPNDKHSLNFGFQSTYIGVKSADWNTNNFHQKEKRNAWENTLWLNEEWKTGDRLSLSAGLRFNAFSVLGGAPYYILDNSGEIAETLNYDRGKIVKTYFALEPRFSANYHLTELMSLKGGYSRTSQNIHALRNSGMSLPFDRYTMSSNLVKPQTADQVSLGYMTLTNNRQYEFSLEGYYKSIDNVLDYKDGKSFSSEIEIERLVLAGQGRAYGAEFYARKNTGRLTGWIAYTLSWSENKIPGINKNKWYTAGNDRRHDISIVGMYELPRGWHAAATWVYNTGQALSAPSAKYELNGETVYYYSERNGYRAPAYHRFDISFTHSKKLKKYTREWSFGIYNLYNRYNPYIITFENDDSKPSGTKTEMISLFGMIPSISYNFKF